MKKMKTFVIGDIHGSLRALKQVLIKSGAELHNDRIIFLGDYVDGWSESAEVVDFLILLKKTNPNVIFIKGNHDVWCQDWLNFGHTPIMWTQQGGQATLDSYVRTEFLVDKSHKDFFNMLEDWYIDEENRIYIHGGWAYKEADFPKSASYPVNAGVQAKECHWDRTIFKDTAQMQFMREIRGQKDAFKSVEKALNQFKEVYIGHTALKNGEVYNYHNLWNMDAGCGWHGKLACMNVDTKEVFYSELSKDLYPEEKERR